MIEITDIKLAGQDCKVAPPPFTPEVCELIELLEESNKVVKEDGNPFQKNGRMLSLIRKLALDCLIRGGHSPEEANTILSNVAMSADAEHGIPSLVAAIGLE